MSENNEILIDNIKTQMYELYTDFKTFLVSREKEKQNNDFQQEITSTTEPETMIKYLKNCIQILIDEKKNNKEKNDTMTSSDNNYIIKQLESYTKKLESDIKYYIKKVFTYKIQKDSLENKVKAYMEIEEEYEELKEKVKYENGKFLNNDRKDNEIIIIRGENTNLKKTINNLEKQFAEIKKQISEKEKIISELETEKKNLKIKLEEVQKQNDILNSHSINININNVTGTNNKNSIQHNNNINNIENINRHVSGKYPNYFNCDLNSGFIRDENKNKYFPYKKINSKILNNKNIQRNILSNTK
jgi:chromosome segregation ATPase